MKTFGLAALILVLAGSSFAFTQEVPKPAPAVAPSGQPPSISPLTPAEKAMRRFHRYDAGRSGPVEIFSPVPRDPRNSPPWAIPSGGAAVVAPSPMMQREMTGHPQVPPISDGTER
jgi:hypothetical protein